MPRERPPMSSWSRDASRGEKEEGGGRGTGNLLAPFPFRCFPVNFLELCYYHYFTFFIVLTSCSLSSSLSTHT